MEKTVSPCELESKVMLSEDYNDVSIPRASAPKSPTLTSAREVTVETSVKNSESLIADHLYLIISEAKHTCGYLTDM